MTNYRLVAYHNQFGQSEPAILHYEKDGIADLSEISLTGSTAIARLGVPHGFGAKTWSEVNEEAPELVLVVPESVTAAQAKVATAQANLDTAVNNFKQAATPAAGTAVDEARAALASAQDELASARANVAKPEPQKETNVEAQNVNAEQPA